MSEKVCNLLDELQAMLSQGSYSDLDWKIVETLDMIAAETKVNKIISGDSNPKIWFNNDTAPTPMQNKRPPQSEAEMLKEFLSPEDYQDAIAMSRGGTD